jgi:hypothetical protein
LIGNQEIKIRFLEEILHLHRMVLNARRGGEDVREVEREVQEKNRRGNKIWEERRGKMSTEEKAREDRRSVLLIRTFATKKY